MCPKDRKKSNEQVWFQTHDTNNNKKSSFQQLLSVITTQPNTLNNTHTHTQMYTFPPWNPVKSFYLSLSENFKNQAKNPTINNHTETHTHTHPTWNNVACQSEIQN